MPSLWNSLCSEQHNKFSRHNHRKEGTFKFIGEGVEERVQRITLLTGTVFYKSEEEEKVKNENNDRKSIRHREQ